MNVEMQSSPLFSLSSPSFDSYSCGKLAEIAARVVEEFRAESDSELDDVFRYGNEEVSEDKIGELPVVEEGVQYCEEVEDDDDDDFEFTFVTKDIDSSPISADEIFYNGQIRPMFPIFNRDLLVRDAEIDSLNSSKPPTPSSIRLPLKKLFIEDRDPPSCSSSEADDLDRIPPGTYCVWTPKAPGSCKKSNSTGTSKRWKFRDLLHRSNSDGKDFFVFVSPSNSNSKKRDVKADKLEKMSAKPPKVAGTAKAKGSPSADGIPVPARQYSKQEGDRRRSFLPYRQDLVGFFANVNGLSRNLHPF